MEYQQFNHAYNQQRNKVSLNEDALKSFHKMVVDRATMHIRRDVYKEEAPWTRNPILCDYRFTNTHRELDPGSKWIKQLCENNWRRPLEERVYNIVLYRIFNTITSIKIFGYQKMTDDGKITMPPKEDILLASQNQVYTDVFMTIGMRNACFNKLVEKYSKPKCRIDSPRIAFYTAKFVMKELGEISSMETPREFFDRLKNCTGIGKFLAYQMYVDCCQLHDFPFSEDDFVMCGPGCVKGLKLLTDSKSYRSWEEVLYWLRYWVEDAFAQKDLYFDCESLFMDLPEDRRYLTLSTLQNLMCEFSKYRNAELGNRKPKNFYSSRKYPVTRDGIVVPDKELYNPFRKSNKRKEV